jgi:hypothetical protein
VHCLCWADTEEDSQDFRTAHSLIKRWIEVCGNLLDKREVKSCRVRESEVGHLILGIVMDVLGHVRMENRKGSGLGWTFQSLLGRRAGLQHRPWPVLHFFSPSVRRLRPSNLPAAHWKPYGHYWNSFTKPTLQDFGGGPNCVRSLYKRHAAIDIHRNVRDYIPA